MLLHNSKNLVPQLKLCAKRHLPFQATSLHAHIIKLGLDHRQHLPNTLLDTYGKCGLLQEAFQLFNEMPQRDLFSWASLFTAYNQANLPNQTLSIFPAMFALDGIQPDHFVFSSLVKACASLGALRVGKQVHGRFMLSRFSGDDVVKSSLVDMYAKCGLIGAAHSVFNSILSKNMFSWTSMISGFARSGRKSEAIQLLRDMGEKNLFCWTALVVGLVQSGHLMDAFNLFTEMRKEGIGIEDPFILSSLIGASANFSALEVGKQIHGLVLVLGYESNLFVSNALVDMYSKCSDIKAAKSAFDSMDNRDVVSWTSAIVGMAQHGQAEDALLLYDEMISTGQKPNEVTFIGLIYACSHVGLVKKGRHLFNSMVEDYGLNPSLQHYTCLLDLFSRSGHLEEAENLLNITMPFEPDETAWGALLSACKRYGNTQMGVRVADQILILGPKEPSTYILLSNAYAGAGNWESVASVRKLMEAMQVKKEPGYSCIDLGKESQVFLAGETCHVMRDEIYGLLKEVDGGMRKRGYVPDTSFVLHEMDQKDKERQLFWHSERLAVAYGLLKSVPGTVIRVTKNLRVCGDCHTVLKHISSIAKREIVIRDAKRFHHFKDGRCSCSDFW